MTPLINIRSYTTDQYYLDKVFYSNFYRLKPLVDPSNSVVVDVGAHCGYFSLAAMSAGYLKGYSFEPCLENYKVLLRNTEVFPDIMAFLIGVMPEKGFISLEKPKLNDIRFLDYGNLKQGVGENCVAISFKDALESIVAEDKITLLKISTGYSLNFIATSGESLKKVENICFDLPYSSQEVLYIKESLTSLGFSDSLLIELKEKDQNFGFLGFFSKNKLSDVFDVEDLRSKNYEN